MLRTNRFRSTHLAQRTVLALGASGALIACGPTPIVLEDAGPGTDAPMGTTDTGVPRDAGVSNNDFAGAQPLEIGVAAMEAIEAPNDRDFFRFEGTAGDWVVISTEANPEDNPMMIDTVVTLYDSARTQIAENDDAVPRNNTDSEIVIRLPSTGTYYVEVEEFTTWMTGMPAEGMPSYTYGLTVGAIVDGGAFNIDTEAGDDAASAQALRFGGTGGNIAFTLGTFNDATDVDVFSFTVAMPLQLLSVDVMPAGPTGYGSTRASGEMWVTNMAGTEIIARINPRDAMQDDLSPSLPMGSYLLWVGADGGTAGTNDHYVLKALLGQENPVEMETVAGTNDLVAGAEPLSVTDDMGVLRGFILAHLSATDVDMFSFDVPAGRQMNVFCGSASSGSGLQGLRVELLGEAGTTMLGMGTETATEGASVTMVTVAAPGTHYIRISATGQDATVTGNFARCGVALATPMPMP